jgi:hypothetical protein
MGNNELKIYNIVNKATEFAISQDVSYLDLSVFHNLVVSYDSNTIKAYIDGNNIINQTATINWNFSDPNIAKELLIGSIRYAGSYERTLNGLISNLFIGEYKDKNGNVIWTDEYIQGLYEAKKPFNKNL